MSVVFNTKQYQTVAAINGATTLCSFGKPGTTQSFSYNDNGNILSNSQVGDYDYLSDKQHAVFQIGTVGGDTSVVSQCTVTYNFFNQPIRIEEGEYRLELQYGANQQRNRTIKYRNDTIESKRYYFNKYYESEIDYTMDTALVGRYYHYIYGDNGVVAICIYTRKYSSGDSIIIADTALVVNMKGEDITDSLYYIHTDHLGSYCVITDAKKQVRVRNFFDPWGNNVALGRFGISPGSQSGNDLFAARFPNRGFTGHEHYYYFKIINMNGRLYDPVIGRFFSPDKYVANSSFTQDFNRYTYARNNPLMYTDPDGEFIISALLSALSYTLQVAFSPGKFKDNWNWDDFGVSVMIGAASGIMTAGIGGAFGAVASSFTAASIFNELGRAGAHAVAQGVLATGTGGKFWQGAAIGFASSLVSSATHSFHPAGQLLVSSITGGLTAECTGGSFWQGAATAAIITTLNHWAHGGLTRILYSKPKNLTTWDLNGDGKLSKYEADIWWLYGNGEDITVDGNLINLKGFDINNTTYNSDKDGFVYGTVDAFLDLPLETAATYGGSTFKMVDGVPQMQSQGYHYDMQPNVPLRNTLTWLGRPPIMRGVTPQYYRIIIKY